MPLLPAAPRALRRIVIISDFQGGNRENTQLQTPAWFCQQWLAGNRGPGPRPAHRGLNLEVIGGYIERLPLAVLKAGLVDCAEVWTHWHGATPPIEQPGASPFLMRRAFQANGSEAPFSSNDMLGHIAAFGPPSILCVWGLGVSEDVLLACRDSFKIYNSIDAPALRVPFDVSLSISTSFSPARNGSPRWCARAIRRYRRSSCRLDPSLRQNLPSGRSTCRRPTM